MDAAIAAILAAYPIRQPAIIDTLEGFRNESWLIEDAGGLRYVLRRNLQHASVPRIEFQVRFQRHLLQHGFPTAEVIETRGGKSLVLDEHGVPWVLFAHIDGHEFDFENAKQVREAARRLAQFHAIAETFAGDPVALDYQASIRDWWVTAEANLRELEELFARAAVRDELDYLHEWWRWVLVEWPLDRLDALPSGWVYGDYHGRNMVFVGDELGGLFDFDDLERGPLVFDVACGVHKFGREARGSLRIRPDVARNFIDAYARTRGLSDEERAALPMMVAMHYPPSASYHRYCREQRGEDLKLRLRREVGIMRTLRGAMDVVRAAAS